VFLRVNVRSVRVGVSERVHVYLCACVHVYAFACVCVCVRARVCIHMQEGVGMIVGVYIANNRH